MSSLKNWVAKNSLIHQGLIKIYKLIKALFAIRINLHALQEFTYEWRGEQGIGEQNFLFYQRVFTKILKNRQLVVLDVGANDGWFAKVVFRFWPDAKIISFEPLKSMHMHLEKLKLKKESYNYEKIGLGDKVDMLQIHEIGTSGLSSFKDLHADYAYDSNFFDQQVNQSYEVEVTTLDSYIELRKLTNDFILKVDTQGYEMEVLRGAQRLFDSQRIKVVIVEMMTVEKYQGASLYVEIINFLARQGFRMVDIHNSYYEQDGCLSEFDAVFIPEINFTEK